MSAVKKEKQRFEKIEGGKSNKRGGAVGDSNHKLHLALDRQSYAKLVALKGRLRAASFGEVIRRALDAFEIFEPEDATIATTVDTKTNVTSTEPGGVEHIYLQVPAWMKEYLDREKTTRGRTYAETVRQALRILTQLVREREKILIQTMKGDKSDAKNSKPSGSSALPDDALYKLLAIV